MQRNGFTCSSTALKFICESITADWLSANDCDFLSESMGDDAATENEVLAFDDFFEPFELLEPFGRPRPDGAAAINGVDVATDE